MAIEYYGVDSDLVLKFIPNMSMGASSKPLATTDIDQGGIFLDSAASKVSDALFAGGFGLSIEVSSTVYPEAYAILRSTIAECAALMYIKAMGHGYNGEEVSKAVTENDKKIASFASGNSIGGYAITSDYKSSKAVFVHSGSTLTEINDTRRKTTDLF